MAFNPTVTVPIPMRNVRSKCSQKHKWTFIINESPAAAQASNEENSRNRKEY